MLHFSQKNPFSGIKSTTFFLLTIFFRKKIQGNKKNLISLPRDNLILITKQREK